MSVLNHLTDAELEERRIRVKRTIDGSLKELELISEERSRRRVAYGSRIETDPAAPKVAAGRM